METTGSGDGFLNWLKGLPGKTWAWVTGVVGAIALLAVAYFAGRGKRKGDVELEIAVRELDKANKQHDAAQAQVEKIKTKQTRLVSEILAVQALRVEEQAKAEGKTHEEILQRLRDSGDIR